MFIFFRILYAKKKQYWKQSRYQLNSFIIQQNIACDDNNDYHQC
jgi:hypothetical protein